MIYDVAVIGAGVVGGLIARKLSQFNLKIALIEKESDVAMGTSKGNSAIVHAGFDAYSGTLKAELNVAGCEMMPKICEQLHVPYKKNGALVCAFSDEEKKHLEVLLERGKANGVKGLEILNREQLRFTEPNLSDKVKYALHAPDSGIVCPYELTLAAVENAIGNRAELFLEHTATDIEFSDGIYKVICGEKATFRTRYIVNAAGLFSDEIAKMCGDEIEIIPRRGEYLMLDRRAGTLVTTTLFSVPTEKGKGILVSPTVDGNIILGPNANVTEKNDTSTTAEGLAEIESGSAALVPMMNARQVITSFAGIRATPKSKDFVIRFSEKYGQVLHVAGIESPGLASSPAIAEYVLKKLAASGLELVKNPSYKPERSRPRPFREMSPEQRAAAASGNPHYAKIICRCETVTEAEILAAIHSPCPATTLDGIKRRTRAGMGRCQGGFCSVRIVEILSRELGVGMTEITKSGGKSYILTGEVKRKPE